jgi:peptidoglycan/xylan/chitin deacetylase (PgdA/CDA1 family)
VNKTCYLTIDDGPSGDFATKVDYLLAHDVPAIFFCVGANLELRRLEAVCAVRKGFVIGNHTYSHFADFQDHQERSKQEILATESLIDSIYDEAGAIRPARLFRFPGLAKGVPGWPYYNPAGPVPQKYLDVKKIGQAFLGSVGFVRPTWGITYKWFRDYGGLSDLDVDCTYDSFDWGILDPNQEYGYTSLEKVLARMEEHVPEEGRGLNDERSPEIILLHDMPGIEYAFGPMMDRLIEKGMEFKFPPFA